MDLFVSALVSYSSSATRWRKKEFSFSKQLNLGGAGEIVVYGDSSSVKVGVGACAGDAAVSEGVGEEMLLSGCCFVVAVGVLFGDVVE